MTAKETKAAYIADLTSYLLDMLDPSEKEDIARINLIANRLYKVLRAVVKQMDTKQPGRTQKGNLDAAMSSIRTTAMAELRPKKT